MKRFLYYLYRLVFCLFPMNNRKIFFMSYYGAQYGCNPKYLSEYIRDKFDYFKLIWAFTEPEKYEIDGIYKVKYLSLRFFYELYTSRVLVTNYRMPFFYKKNKGQLYIQTWHSSLRLKMIEKDTESSLPIGYVKMAKKDSLQIDGLLSGCKVSTEIFKRAFWYKGPVIETGTPRQDVLFRQDDKIKDLIRTKLNLRKSDKILLYAPTFRKDNTLTYYDIDFQQLVVNLEERFNGNWKVLLRLHPHLRNYSSELVHKDNELIDATFYDDIQELLLIADIVISDYSSLIFDYMITKKPCFLYVPDIENYVQKDRKLYFDIEELPFPICKNNKELHKQIRYFNESSYLAKIDLFNTKIGSYESGYACQNVIDYINKKLNYE